ncbi:MAG TPA: hypothetical protein PKA88_01965 [Polyangiaceae bacterium]|nr:hypothetical protein [Polyangiaceae bacterium]HMR75670.1 hypothetical protein [Polyangiaceae bacterium]
MMRKITYVGVALVCLGCSKRAEDESVKSASTPVAPAQESEPGGVEQPMAPGASPPPAAAAPESPADEEAPASTKKSAEKSKKDGLAAEQGAEFSSIAQAEAALNEKSAQLTKLLGGAKAQALATGDKRCDDACLAFASLKRAADAICRLAGDGDARCTRAKRIVDDNETKLKACSCEE